MDNQLYYVLDIGSTLTKLVVFSFIKKTLLTLHSFIIPTKGVENGYIVNENELKSIIQEAFKSLPPHLESAPVLLVLPSSDVKIYTSTLTNKIDGVITNQIIATLKHDTLKTKILETHEYITSYPIKYIIDENQYFIPPIGVRGTTISLNSCIVTSPKTIAHNYVRLVESLGISIKDIIINACANVQSALYEKESKDGAYLIDIGGKSTTISFVQNRVINSFRKINIGSEAISEEIMKQLHVDYEQADEVKVRFGNAMPSKYDNPIYFENDNGEYLTENTLFGIIDEGLEKIFSQIKVNIDSMTKLNDFPLVFTGGGSHFLNLDKKASLYFRRNVRIAKIKLLGVRHNSFASSVGAVRDYMANKLEYYLEHSRIVGDESLELVSKTMKNDVTSK